VSSTIPADVKLDLEGFLLMHETAVGLADVHCISREALWSEDNNDEA